MRWWYNSSHFTCLGPSLGDKAATDSASFAFLLYSFKYELILSPFSTLITTFDLVLTRMYVSSKTKTDVRSCQEEKKPTFCSDLDDVIMFISHRSTEHRFFPSSTL